MFFLILLLSVGATLAATGCSNSNNNAASGTYTVPITLTPTTGSATTVSLQVVVQ